MTSLLPPADQRQPLRRTRRAATIIPVATLTLLAACGTTPDLKDAAYRVSINNCAGNPLGEATAVAIGSAHVATVAHPFLEFESLELVSPTGDRLDGTLVYADFDTDVAVIETEMSDIAHLPLGAPVADSPIDLGTFVDTTYEPDSGTIVRTLTIRLDGAGERAGMELAAAVEPGDSGAAVVADGSVVGIVFASSNSARDRSWAISSTEYAEALRVVSDGASPPAPTCP